MKFFRSEVGLASEGDDQQIRNQFCVNILDKSDENQFDGSQIFSNEGTFNTNDKFNKDNARIWGEFPVPQTNTRVT